MVLLRFLTEDSGAVTVDWTVLAAAVVGLGVATVATVRSGTSALGTDINASLNSASVVSLDTLGDDGLFHPDDYSFLPANTAWWEAQWGMFDGYSDTQLTNYYNFALSQFYSNALANNDQAYAAHRYNEFRIAFNEANERGLSHLGGSELSDMWNTYRARWP